MPKKIPVKTVEPSIKKICARKPAITSYDPYFSKNLYQHNSTPSSVAHDATATLFYDPYFPKLARNVIQGR